MTFKGVPFISSKYDKFRGADVNLISKRINEEDSKGFDITGISKWCEYKDKKDSNKKVNNKGFDITGLFKYVQGNNSGVDLSLLKEVDKDNIGVDLIGFVKQIGRDNKGVDVIGGMKYVKEDNKGADLTGIVKIVEGENKGLSITGIYNQFGKVNDWNISYATFGNVIKEVGPNAFYLQLGLFNKAGDTYCPIINIGGMKNLLRKLKKENK